MRQHCLSDEFKRDVAAQITDRGYPVAGVSQRPGVSPHQLYARVGPRRCGALPAAGISWMCPPAFLDAVHCRCRRSNRLDRV